jgi:hypothetical protein
VTMQEEMARERERVATIRTPSPEVMREATKIARDKVREVLHRKRIAVKALPEGRFDELVRDVIQRYPAIRAEAERRVKVQHAMLSEI